MSLSVKLLMEVAGGAKCSCSALCCDIVSVAGTEICSVTGFCRAHPQLPDALLSPLRPYLLASIAPRCQGSVGSIVGLVPGVISLSPGESVAGAHQGRHSKSSQYRRMKAEWKSNVYLARSRIQVGHLQHSPNT